MAQGDPPKPGVTNTSGDSPLLTEPFLRAIRRVGGIAGRQNPGSIPCLLVDNQNCVDGPCSGSAWCCNRYQCHRFMYRGTRTLEHCLFVRFPFCLLALWQGRLVSNGQAASQLIKLLYGHKQLTTSGMGWQSRIKAHLSTNSTASILDHSVETLNIWQMCFFAITTLVSLIAVVAANPFTVSLSADDSITCKPKCTGHSYTDTDCHLFPWCICQGVRWNTIVSTSC